MSCPTPDEINAFLRRDFDGSSNRCESIGAGWAVAVIDVGDGNLRPGGIISGPTQFGLCDAALYDVCLQRAGHLADDGDERDVHPLPACRFGHGAARRADLVKVGRRAIVGNVTAWTGSSGKPVCVAQGTYMPPASPR